MGKSYTPMVLPKEYPFRDEVEAHIRSGESSATGMLLSEEITLTKKKTYLNLPWIRMFQNKEKLQNLSPWAWKVLGYIGLNMEMNQHKIKLDRQEIGLDKRKYSATLQELEAADILRGTGTRQWYWINLTIIIFGNVDKTHPYDRLLEE